MAVAIHDEKEMGGSAMFCYSHGSLIGVGMSANQNSYPWGSTILDHNELKNIKINVDDGQMKCSFTRPKLTNIQDIDYDLTNQYYLLLAEGLLQEGRGFSIRYFLRKIFLNWLCQKSHSS